MPETTANNAIYWQKPETTTARLNIDNDNNNNDDNNGNNKETRVHNGRSRARRRRPLCWNRNWIGPDVDKLPFVIVVVVVW